MQLFGERLKYFMELRNMSRKELSERTHLTEAAISRYISGGREPKAIAVAHIARALDISTDELLGVELSGEDKVDDALRLIARNARGISSEQKKALIEALIG